jgi:cathepsin D
MHLLSPKPPLAPCALVLLATSACEGSVASGGNTLPGGDGGVNAGVEAGDETRAQPAPFAVPLSACVPATYTASVTIGGSQAFELMLDTGSASLGVASASCMSCGGVKPTYTPGATAVDQHRTATSQFGTGKWSGEVYRDSVAPTSSTGAPVRLVAIDSQSQFFVPSWCNSRSGTYQGILGMGPTFAAVHGTNGYFDALVAAQNVPNVFATRLCDSGGTLWLGGYDPAATTAAPVYTPEIAGFDSIYYAVSLVSVEVAGRTAPIASAQHTDSVVDTGTSVFLLQTSAFNTITRAIAASPGFASVFGTVGASFFTGQKSCRVVSKKKAEIDAALPPLTLVFGQSPALSVHAAPTESYLVPYGNAWCSSLYAIDPALNIPVASILGGPILRSNVVIFDRANKRIGFAPHTPCP